MIKKADIILLIIILIFGFAVSFFALNGNSASSGNIVVVSLNGDIYGEYDLYTDREIQIVDGDHTNNITIKDGTVQMAYSNCLNQICVKTGVISSVGRQIVCLPHKLLVEIKSESGGDLDVISE